jgi:hypothetical protein
VLEPSVGVSYANILAFDNSGLIPGVNNSTSVGPMYGITAGSRFSIVTVAARLDSRATTPTTWAPWARGCRCTSPSPW